MPYKNRLEELTNFIIEISKKYDDYDEVDLEEVKMDFLNILLAIADINENDKSIYNTAYRAAYRIATMDHLGGACEMCGNTNYNELEIDHIDGAGVKSKSGRGIEDWKDLSVLRLLCGENSVNKCHSKTWNYKRGFKK